MPEAANLVDQLKRSHEGDAWHGSALGELLTDISAQEAAARPVPNAHSIWEIVLHITAWNNVWASPLEGHRAGDPEEGDWPPVEDTSQEAWQQAKAKLDRVQQRLLEVISTLPDSRLHENVLDKDISTGFMLYGILQHTVYHTGQIALLKKARTQAP